MKIVHLILLILLSACCASKTNNAATTSEIPVFIQQKIDSFKLLPMQNPPIQINAFLYKGDTVYHITAPCCDQFSDLYQGNGLLLGHPDGGFTGRGDGRLPDFSDSARLLKIVWKDDRVAK